MASRFPLGRHARLSAVMLADQVRSGVKFLDTSRLWCYGYHVFDPSSTRTTITQRMAFPRFGPSIYNFSCVDFDKSVSDIGNGSANTLVKTA